MSGILVAGTSSDAGKSLVVTALCRAAWRRGIDVVPYKAQNMSNNSMVCPDGSEIGRAQYLQASAARVTPESAMNPVLLKPGTDRRSFIVLRGTPGGVLEAGQYATGRRHLAEAAWAAYDELSAAHDMVICEGAGSPAEINLRTGDYTNMGLAREKNLPVVLVGDIDRGGVLASLFAPGRCSTTRTVPCWPGTSSTNSAVMSPFSLPVWRRSLVAPECRVSGCCPGSPRCGSTVRMRWRWDVGVTTGTPVQPTICGLPSSGCRESPTPPMSTPWPPRPGSTSR